MIVLDTSALIFWTLDKERLSRAASWAIADADRILLSSISIWEIGLKVMKQRLFIPVSIQEFTEGLERIDRVDIRPVDVRTWIKNLELDWEHRDPADRTIVATASLHACPLVTSDAAIRSFYSHTIW
ncbi:MAG: type II toxin-antitoxin system VapC family toxin [Deltaproteobacteria bacterium]|nr:type II toxin-antitoxin system VapC family toxin [Deltaproteobacteria bacterium]